MKERERKGWASSKLSSWAHGTRLAWADPGPKQLYWPKKMLMSRAASSQLDHPLGSTTSSMYVKANTTRAKRPQARPRFRATNPWLSMATVALWYVVNRLPCRSTLLAVSFHSRTVLLLPSPCRVMNGLAFGTTTFSLQSQKAHPNHSTEKSWPQNLMPIFSGKAVPCRKLTSRFLL